MPIIPALILIPAVTGVTAFILHSNRIRRLMLITTAFLHVIFTGYTWLSVNHQPKSALNGWLAIDCLGLLFLSLVSVLFLACSIYGLGYLEKEQSGVKVKADFVEDGFFSNAPEARFIGCLLLFLSSMSLVCLSHHFGLFWVAMEATTLASAPLIFFHRHHRSLEATWKYLLLCSVGIALALLGNSFLTVAGPALPLRLEILLSHAAELNVTWLRTAFLLFLVGYGTKMGLAPMHSWLPDAHSESPSLVSALLSGALLNCAFLGILRMHQILVATGQAAFGQELLVLFGLISMGVATIFIQGQSDYKRLLAYSSMEHMGIAAFGVGLGSIGTFGAIFHAVNHSIIKAMLFLVAGNILSAYRTKSINSVKGILQNLPFNGILWLTGFLAICGLPPFGSFISEFTILKAAVDQNRMFVAFIYLVFLALIFLGMTALVIRMVYGPATNEPQQERRENWSSIIPPAAFIAGSLILGLYLPAPLRLILNEAAKMLGGSW